jgi:hypothetical protein
MHDFGSQRPYMVGFRELERERVATESFAQETVEAAELGGGVEEAAFDFA